MIDYVILDAYGNPMKRPELKEYVYILNHLGGGDDELPRDAIKVKVVPYGSEGVKAVRVTHSPAPGVSMVYVVQTDAEASINIINHYNLPWYVQYYFQTFGIRWKPY